MTPPMKPFEVPGWWLQYGGWKDADIFDRWIQDKSAKTLDEFSELEIRRLKALLLAPTYS